MAILKGKDFQKQFNITVDGANQDITALVLITMRLFDVKGNFIEQFAYPNTAGYTDLILDGTYNYICYMKVTGSNTTGKKTGMMYALIDISATDTDFGDNQYNPGYKIDIDVLE